MSINSIALRKFKCFNELEVDLSKITLLTGANSSGKSSLLYGILAPFQSREFPLYLSPNGKYVNMGDFIEISFGNSTTHQIGLDISLADSEAKRYSFEGERYDFKTNWEIDPSNSLPRLTHLSVTASYFTLQITSNELNSQHIVELSVDHELKAKSRNSQLTQALEELIDATTETAPISAVSQISFKVGPLYQQDKENMACTTRKLFNLLQTIFKIIERLDDEINFVGSFRHQPDRTYYQKAKSDDRVGRFGEGYIDQILEWEHKNAEKFGQLTEIVRKLELLQSMRSKKLPGGRFELRVQVQNKAPWCSLADVGFGISQFLPIIVADLQLSRHSTLLIAQPEIHLHPKIQASVADYLVTRAKQDKKRYIVETHSEYLLNRIRLLIVKGEIAPEEVAVYYFINEAEGSTSYQIEFATDGRILGAPNDFFDTYMMDVMDIALYA
jgi:predicted ATPase